MKKHTLLSLLMAAVLMIQGCKNDSDDPAPSSEVQVPNSSIPFLKSVSVPGAYSITFDSTQKAFAVTLPENFVEGNAEIKLNMHDNVLLMDSTGKASPGSSINYSFRGRDPLTFTLKDKEDRYAGYFKVYFAVSGNPKVELTTKDIMVNTDGFISPFRWISGVGTIPARPDGVMPTVKAINRKTGVSSEAVLYPNQQNIYLENFDNPIGNDPVALEVDFKTQNAVVFEDVKFSRGSAVAAIAQDNKVIYGSKDSLFATGGYFVSSAKYSARFSSDFVTTPFAAAAKFNSTTQLTVEKIPANMPEGSYLVSFYEGETVIGKSVIYVSQNASAKVVETIWTGDVMGALNRNADKLAFKKGSTFFAKPSPLEYGVANTKFDKGKLPALQLKNGSSVIELKPELAVVNWAIAGVSYPVGKYVLPAGTANGSYEVIAVFPDKTVSKPYWSKLQVN